MKTILAGLLTGLALGALCLLGKGVFAKGAPLVLLAFFLVGISLGLVATREAFFAAFVAAAGPFVVDVTTIAIDTARDRTSHNLWPFEVLAMLAIGFLPTGIGFLIGYVLKKVTGLGPKAALVPAGCALVVVLFSPLFSLMLERHDQDHAMRILRSLWEAERSYAAEDPEHRFTCEGLLLPGFEHRQWFAWTSMGLESKNHMQEGRYWFQLSCGPLSRGDSVAVSAMPVVPSGAVYCIDKAGAIHGGPNQTPHCGE